MNELLQPQQLMEGVEEQELSQKNTRLLELCPSPCMREVRELIKKCAQKKVTVLLLGETGSGKGVVANAIHEQSRRGKRRMFSMNCGNYTSTLMESTLFGHVKGAFTGASAQRKGVFEAADGTTLFMDEIGELSLDHQTRLLNVLEDRQFTRLGGIEPVKTDFRLIAASNRRLEEMVAAKTFREDLYYRLSVFEITVPPLRERREDIIPLAMHFLSTLDKTVRRKIQFAAQCEKELLEREWPGNVRELKNAVERAMLLVGEDDPVIYPKHLRRKFQVRPKSHAPLTYMRSVQPVYDGTDLPNIDPVQAVMDYAERQGWSLDELNKHLVRYILCKHLGARSRVSKLLGINPRTLRSRIHRWKLVTK